MKTPTTRRKNAPKFTELTVKIRLKPERLEWFSSMSDRLGLTRDQAVSGMLESNMGADERGIGVEEAQKFAACAAAELFPERPTLRALERAYTQAELGEQKLETAQEAALLELFDLAPKEMGSTALHHTKMGLLRAESRKRKVAAS